MSLFFFCFLGVNMRWDANSLSARMLHLLHQFVPDLYSVTLIWDSVKCGCGRRMRTADGGWRTADGQKKKKEIIEKKNDMKNNKLIIKIVGQLMPFK